MLSPEAFFEEEDDEEQAIRGREKVPVSETKRVEFPMEEAEKIEVLEESSFGREDGETRRGWKEKVAIVAILHSYANRRERESESRVLWKEVDRLVGIYRESIRS